MAIAVIASTSAGTTDNVHATTPAIDTTGANLLLVSAVWYHSNQGVTLIDSKGNTWSPVAAQVGSTDGKQFTFSCASPTVGAGHTFTFAPTDGTSPIYPSVAVLAVSGASATHLSAVSANTAAGTSIQPGAIAATSDGSLFVAGIHDGNGAAAAVDGGFTAVTVGRSSGGQAGGLAYKIQGTAASENPTFSWTDSQTAITTMAVFPAAAVVTSGPTTCVVTGSANLTVGTSATFTFTLNSPAGAGGVSIVPSSTGFTAAFGTNPVTIGAGQTVGTTTVNASTAGAGTVTGTSSGISFTPASTTAAAAAVIVAAATAYTLSAPSPAGGTVGMASGNFTLQANGAPSSTLIVTPSDGAGGAFTPPTMSITDSAAHTFRYTPSSVGVKSIAVAHTGGSGISGDPSPVGFTAAIGGQLSVYYPTPSLSTIYFTIANSTNQSWNGSAFETTTPAGWARYVIAATDSGGTGNYVGNFPGAIPAGVYSVYGWHEAGTAAASTDTLVGTELAASWNGTTLSAVVAGPGNGLTSSGTTLTQAESSTLWGTADRLAAANSLSANVRSYLCMPRRGRAQEFWDGFEQLTTSYFGGAPVDAADALARFTDYANALNALAQVGAEIVALATANPGTLKTTVAATGTSASTVRTFS